MKKAAIFFFSIFVIGLAMAIMQIAVLQYDGKIGLGILLFGVVMMFVGGTSSCLLSSKARAFFRALLDTLFGSF
ncbi:MAG: hypothetical protein FWD27_07620 [Coriobacteriia bacterium]|nr:hypothetical protein [Coriobacteriia bacterium]